MKTLNVTLKSIALGALLFYSSCANTYELGKNSVKKESEKSILEDAALELCVEHKHDYEGVFPGITSISNAAVEEVADYLNTNGIETEIVEDSPTCEKIIFQDLASFAQSYNPTSFENHRDKQSLQAEYGELLDIVSGEESIIQVYDDHSSKIIGDRLTNLRKGLDTGSEFYQTDSSFSGVYEAVSRSQEAIDPLHLYSLIYEFERVAGVQSYMHSDLRGESLINLKSIVDNSTRFLLPENEANIDEALKQYISQIVAHEVLHSFQLPHPWQFAQGYERDVHEDQVRGVCENKDTLNIMSYGQNPNLNLDNFHISGLQVDYINESIDYKKSVFEAVQNGNTMPLRVNEPATMNYINNNHSALEYMCSENPHKR